MAVTAGVGSMEESEVLNFIKDSRCGILTLVDGDKPYPVPVEHYFDGKSLHFVTSTRDGQRKIKCIKNNANASYVLSDSRREKPELVKKGILMLKLDVEEISNWKCPAKTCDWPTPWFERYSSLLEDL